jgi:hypothetical protein
MTQSTFESAFNQYAIASDPCKRQRAFTAWVALKALPRPTEAPRFVQGLEYWRTKLTRREVPEEIRWLAVARS